MKQTDIVSTLTHPEGTVAALAVIWRLVSAVQFYFLLFFFFDVLLFAPVVHQHKQTLKQSLVTNC